MYQIPIIAALLLFPVLAGLFLIPFAYRMYHRYGHIPLWRTFVFYSFVYYILALIFYIVLPLPVVTPNFCTIYHTATIPQLHPFQFLNDIARETSGLGLHDVLTSRAFWQAFLNVLLFVPLGVYLRYYYRWRFPLTIGIAFATSLFLELTPYTGLWHLYPCAYRLFDVDDIMLNTTGAVLGYGLAFCTRFLPSLQPGRIVSPHPVSLFRRLFAWVIDAIVIFICPLVIYAIIVSLLISYNRLTLLNTLISTYGSTFFCTCIFVFAFLDFVFFPSHSMERQLASRLLR
jgi:glycopeptide antibiotics resistance protein